MVRGTVKWFHLKKGYGFLTTEDGQDVFFRKDDLKTDLPFLKEDNIVEFDMEKDRFGLVAKNVIKAD